MYECDLCPVASKLKNTIICMDVYYDQFQHHILEQYPESPFVYQ